VVDLLIACEVPGHFGLSDGALVALCVRVAVTSKYQQSGG
jgi:hypothetical protein